MPLLPALPSVGDHPPLAQLPSLAWICLSILYHYPDQVHQIPYRLNHRPELNTIDDVLAMDPRMWAALVQLYDDLPDCMRAFGIPLRDSHMPKLQSIPCTARFSMITVLEAPACRHLCDDNIASLKELSTLAALDASDTRLTSHGIKAFASTLHGDAGPWGLRILDLRECPGITTDVYAHLSKFPLLTVVDLRGTKCNRKFPPPPGFLSKGHPLFFHPTKLSDSLARLHEANPSMHSSPNAFTLLVNAVDHPKKPVAEGLLSHDNTVVTIADDSLYLDNGNAIARRAEAREERLRHEENSADWHRRRELLETTEEEYEPLLSVRRKASTRGPPTQPNAIAGPSRLPLIACIPLAPRRVPRGPHSGFQLTPLARSSAARFSASTDRAPVSVRATTSSRFRGDPSAPRPSSTLLSGTTQLTTSRHLPLPPRRSHPNPYSPSLPNDLQPTPPTARLSARPDRDGQPKRSAPSLGVQAPRRHDPSTAETRIWGNPDEEPFMLYRDPPSWSALEKAQCERRMHEANRRGELKRNVEMRASGVAHIDLSGKRAAAAKQQIGNLLAKRTEMRQTFGLLRATSTSTPALTTFIPLPSTNPFKKRTMAPLAKHVSEGPAFLCPPTPATSSKGKERELIPLSKIPTPVFTQNLLDVSAKENRKTALGSGGCSQSTPAMKKQKRSSLPSSSTKAKSKQPRASEPGIGDLRKWLATK